MQVDWCASWLACDALSISLLSGVNDAEQSSMDALLVIMLSSMLCSYELPMQQALIAAFRLSRCTAHAPHAALELKRMEQGRAPMGMGMAAASRARRLLTASLEVLILNCKRPEPVLDPEPESSRDSRSFGAASDSSAASSAASSGCSESQSQVRCCSISGDSSGDSGVAFAASAATMCPADALNLNTPLDDDDNYHADDGHDWTRTWESPPSMRDRCG